MDSDNTALSSEELAIIEEETAILAKTQGALTLQVLPEEQKNYHDDILELRDSLSESRTEDLPAVVAHMERLVQLARQQAKSTADLPTNHLNPYFAHIRLEEENRKRDILIGNQHCMLDHMIFPIIDWKHAPLSQIYYRYQEGDEYSEEFGEKQMEGILSIRRTISIENGRLNRIDTGSYSLIHTEEGWQRKERNLSQLHGGSGTATRPVNIAGKKEGAGFRAQAIRKDKYLQEISALIDREQFEIITRPEAGIVVIQGGAGSGKTTVALHRLAYLTALKPEYYVPSRVMSVVFNKALAKYISKVLPALGAEATRSWVYQDWTASLRRRYFPKLPNRYSEHTPVSVIEVKRHPAMLEFLQNEVRACEDDISQRLKNALTEIPGKETALLAWKILAHRPLARRILQFSRWSLGQEEIPELPSCQDYILKTRIQHLLEEMFPEIRSDPSSLACSIWEEGFIHKNQLETTFSRLAPGAFTPAQFKEVRNWSIQNYEKRHYSETIVDEGYLNPPEMEVPKLDEEDDTLLLLLYQLTMGPFRGKKNKIIQYPHILIDEAQDFSPVELKLLLNTAPQKRRSITLAGDFDQQIMLGSQLGGWSEMFRYLNLEDASISSLKIGYRSTHEIIEVAKAVIGPMSVNQEWSAVRHGGPVELFKFQNHGHLINFLAETLIEVSVREPAASVAVLARYSGQADLVYEGLIKADVPKIQRVRDQDFSFSPGIEISDIFQVKGLEFDYVILLDVDEQTFPEDEKARNLLYVGVTRAAHQLWVMTCRQPSPLLPVELMKEGN
ncbi:MAG: AAA family ATPase [SAR324 cluster bacterium]|nr:AAA family ATPase [SAR324 cluster bacterium]